MWKNGRVSLMVLIGVIVIVALFTCFWFAQTSPSDKTAEAKGPGMGETLEAKHTSELLDSYVNEHRINIIQPGESVQSNIAAIIISLDRTPIRLQQTVTGLQRIGWTGPVYHFRAIDQPQGKGAMGCYMSHLTVMKWIHSKGLHDIRYLILEDDFEFDKDAVPSQAVFMEWYERMVKVTRDRWDKWYVSQYILDWEPLDKEQLVYRIHKGRTDAGYMVHPDFLERLIHAHEQDLQSKTERPWNFADELDQCLPHMYKQHIYIGNRVSLGYQRINTSTISSFPDADTRWSMISNSMFRGQFNRQHKLITRQGTGLQLVAVCLVATGKYKQYVDSIVRDCRLYFAKPHILTFIVFTDAQESLIVDHSSYAYHQIFIPRKGFPGDTLYRYHYILKAEEILQTMNYIYYMDVDYHIAEPVLDTDIFSDLIAVKHLNNLVGTASSSFEQRPQSRAFVPDPSRKTYFAGGFQGGECKHFLQACTTIRDQIDEDDRNGIMAVWHDESHWNAYLWNRQPPTRILDQSYIFDERCLRDKGSYPGDHCGPVQQFTAIMIPLSKNHKEVRT